MLTSTRNKSFPSYDFIIINASTLRKTPKIIYIWPENSYENSIPLPKMSFKICYDAQVLHGNLVSPEESFSKCPGKGKETTGKKSWGQPELWPLHRRSLLFEQTLNFCCFFFVDFFSIKASQCTQVDRKQMEHRYLIYSENFIAFLIYIPVLNQYNLVPRVLSYPSGRLGERTWERGCKPTFVVID